MRESFDELTGVAHIVGLPFARLVAFNFLQEVATLCTSVLIKALDGRMLLARNLDFDFAPVLSDLAYEARFIQKGKEVFRAVMFAGTTAVFTGQRTGSYALSMNSRPARSPSELLDSLLALLDGAT